MNAYSRWATMVLLAATLTTGSVVTYAAESHTDGHSDSGHTDGKKGPKYMGGGNKGGSHSSSAHKGGSSHNDSSEGGSKSTERKIFHGNSGGHDEASTAAGHESSGTALTHCSFIRCSTQGTRFVCPFFVPPPDTHCLRLMPAGHTPDTPAAYDAFHRPARTARYAIAACRVTFHFQFFKGIRL